jgi:hypothetical protein
LVSSLRAKSKNKSVTPDTAFAFIKKDIDYRRKIIVMKLKENNPSIPVEFHLAGGGGGGTSRQKLWGELPMFCSRTTTSSKAARS